MSVMQLMRPKLLASSCVVAACLLPGGAFAAGPTTAEQPAKAEAQGAAKPPAAPSSQAAPPQPAPSPAPAAEPAAAAPPSPEVLLEAKQRFDRGFELYEEGEYPLALIEFNRAYE